MVERIAHALATDGVADRTRTPTALLLEADKTAETPLAPGEVHAASPHAEGEAAVQSKTHSGGVVEC